MSGITIVRILTAIYPEDSATFAVTGIAWLELSETDNAERCFRKALDLGLESAHVAYLWLISVLVAAILQDNSNGRKKLLPAIEKAPNHTSQLLVHISESIN